MEHSKNRTGLRASADLAEKMKQASQSSSVEVGADHGSDYVRQSFTHLRGNLGSVPRAAGRQPLAKININVPDPDSSIGQVYNKRAEQLTNKLGQRLALERAGARLYDALILKCETVADDFTLSVISVDLLKQFREEEVNHSCMLTAAMDHLGMDPTALTPDADASAIASLGLSKVLSEPRTTVLQCLEAIQTAELTDNVGWALLRELCLDLDLTQIADEFGRALAQEEVHAEMVTEWIRQLAIPKEVGDTSAS